MNNQNREQVLYTLLVQMYFLHNQDLNLYEDETLLSIKEVRQKVDKIIESVINTQQKVVFKKEERINDDFSKIKRISKLSETLYEVEVRIADYYTGINYKSVRDWACTFNGATDKLKQLETQL